MKNLMDIRTIHTFLVNSEKGQETTTISGNEVTSRSGQLYLLLESIFLNAPAECEHEIIFNHNEKGEQKNACKDLIVKYTKNRTYDNGRRHSLLYKVGVQTRFLRN